ncbi:MAG: BMP family protein [Clostridiales bacterium]|nr:BMP family protein [Clostridiales bacterium]
MKKRILAIALCGAMGAALLAGCGSGSSSDSATDDGSAAAENTEAEETASALDGSWPEETVKIGVEAFDTTDEQFIALQDYLDYLTDYYNIEFMYSESIENAEGEMDFIDSCASAGCSAILAYYNVAGAETIQRAIDQGMYYWGTEQYGLEFLDNEMYLGCYTFTEGDSEENGDYLGGYEMAYSLAEQGVTHVFYCNGGASFGVQMFIDRQSGFEAGIAAAQADGYEITYDASADVVEGWPGTDDFTAAVSTMLASDYDGAAVSFNAATLFQPIADAGKEGSVSVAAIGGVNDTYYDAVNNGVVTTIVYDCEEVVFGNAVVQILNAVTGHVDATRTADDESGLVLTYRWTIADADSFNAIYDYHDSGNYFVSADDMTQYLAEFNEDVTFEDVNAYYSSFDLDTALAGIQ